MLTRPGLMGRVSMPITLSFALRPLCAALVFMLTGCTGSARIDFVSLHNSEIDPPPAKTWRFDAHEAVWWIDDAGELNLAFHAQKRNLFLGKYGDVDLNLSLTPGPPPAGRARNYKIRRRETRTRIDNAFGQQRYTSYAGIMYVILEEDQTLHGSFRIWMKPPRELNFFTVLPRTPGSLLCYGTFHAVKDQHNRGPAIRSHCESGGRQRPPLPTQPTSRPSAD